MGYGGKDQAMVSVIVPVYNAADLVGETLDSIMAQDYPEWELIVVDDGSTDHSAEVVAPYLADQRVRFITKPNGGVASARNLGVREARGELVAFCDSDDLWAPDKLTRQMELLSEPEVVLVYCGIELLMPDGSIKPMPELHHPEGRCFDELVVGNAVTCSSVVAKKSVVMDAGMFDERRELMGLEDKHLWLRMALLGTIRAVPEPLVRYRITQVGILAL